MRSRGEGVSNQRGLRRSGRSHGDDGACVGIIAGSTTMSSVKNCRAVDGSITAEGNATWGFGALCGAPWGAPEITDCEAVGTKITVSGEGNRLVGGLVGFVHRLLIRMCDGFVNMRIVKVRIREK